MTNLDAIIKDPIKPATACVIWLHGLGADGGDFAGIVPELNLPKDHTIRFIFPHAPIRPITLNGGFEMPGWYDITSLDRNAIQDIEGIQETTREIHAMIAEQLQQGIASTKIILAGFSQGGAISLFSGLTYDKSLGGILALSTYLPIADTFRKTRHNANQNTPILMVHGTQDNIVALEFGQQSEMVLKEMGYPITWQAYPMGHSVCKPELQLIGQWLQQRLLSA
jgi:phospholipase/carboxylesterase